MPEGFLKRFLKGKVTDEEVVAHGGKAGDQQDSTNPALVRNILNSPDISNAQIKEAIAFAERMDYGDVKEVLESEMSRRDKISFGAVGSQMATQTKLNDDVLRVIKSNLGGRKKRGTRKGGKKSRRTRRR